MQGSEGFYTTSSSHIVAHKTQQGLLVSQVTLFSIEIITVVTSACTFMRSYTVLWKVHRHTSLG